LKVAILPLLLVLLVISIALVPHSLVNAKSKDSKARDAIIKAIGKSVEGRYSQIKLIQLSKSNVSGYILAYNTTKAVPLPPPPSPPPTPTPTPVPNPTGPTTKVCLVGDLKGSTIPSKMKDCALKIGLGDLGYGSDLSYFKGLHFDRCVAGNHDTKEDGSSSLESETLAYCGDHWSQKIANGTTLLIGINTNGDSTSQKNFVQSAISQNLQVKTIVIMSHKGGHVPPNSHHPAEAANLYAQLESIIPANVHLYEVYGHNHVSSSAPSKNWYQAGSGGKSFYECGTDSVWTYCDNKHLGYLQATIDNTNGNVKMDFIY